MSRVIVLKFQVQYKKTRGYQEDLRQRLSFGPPMESPIHDDGFEVRSVVDMEGTDQSESEHESDNESDVYKISCCIFFVQGGRSPQV